MKPTHDEPADLTAGVRRCETGLCRTVDSQLAPAAITTNQIFSRQVPDAFDLRPVDFTLLARLHENPGTSAKRLAQAQAVTPPNITLSMDRLDGCGKALA